MQLPEPYATYAEYNGSVRFLNLQLEWGKSFKCKPRYPQAGAIVNSKFTPSECSLFLEVLKSSTKKIFEDPYSSSIKGQKILDIDRKIIEKSFQYCNLETVPGSESLMEINKFFDIVNKFSNNLIEDRILIDNFVGI